MARAILQERGLAFVVVRDGTILGQGTGPGIRELLDFADQPGQDARGAALADRIIGRAAAMIARSMGIAAVHAVLMSEGGRQVLAEGGIGATSDRIVPAVRNRAGDGPCPMEARVAAIADPGEAMAALRAMIARGRPPA